MAGYERSLLAEKLWYLYHDLSEGTREAGYLSCLSEIKGNGFPEETRRLAEQLSAPAFRQTLKEEYAAFWTAYQQDRDLLRFHYHLSLIHISGAAADRRHRPKCRARSHPRRKEQAR